VVRGWQKKEEGKGGFSKFMWERGEEYVKVLAMPGEGCSEVKEESIEKEGKGEKD